MDGYMLTTFRIPGGRISPARSGKPSVLLLHGMGSWSEAWIALPNDKNLVSIGLKMGLLAYMLADAGWDVWLGNNRGSSYSNGHTSLNSAFEPYWNFSWHEMGIYDLPTIVDQAIAVSGNEKIFVIGHSQGGVEVLVGTSEIPELNDKIHAAYLMAPAAFLGGAYDPFFGALLPIVNTPLEDVLYAVLRGRLQRRNPRILSTIFGIQPHALCQPRAIRCGLCDQYLLGLYSFNPTQMNYTNIPRIMAKLFDVENIKSDIHFGQNILSCMFRKYDYGSSENQRRYGSVDPPDYNLEQIRTPVYLLWAEQDTLITPPDIQRLASRLSPSTLREVIRVEDDTFNHGDFALARDANILVYRPLIEKMNAFWNEVSSSA
ncbi:Lipase 3 [Orchesella cincta]|uniref:Lipase n=1 Tax=Orchesella cincta TaxID=48709 RepID=A0A1D2N7E4_ORCCI|nr:Lipase 3 [Orchesella cincta]